jgi:pyrroline-5-carboxylate reductase
MTSWFEDEAKIDAVTAISGSGPAYVFYFIEALQQAALELGFSPEQASQFAIATFEGAASLALHADEPVATLREKVTSKGGTTFAALSSMQEAGIQTAIVRAAKAAAQRATELGDEFGQQA